MNPRTSRTVQRMYQSFGGDQQDADNQRDGMTTLEKIKLSGTHRCTATRRVNRLLSLSCAWLSAETRLLDHKADWKDRESRLNWIAASARERAVLLSAFNTGKDSE